MDSGSVCVCTTSAVLGVPSEFLGVQGVLFGVQ